LDADGLIFIGDQGGWLYAINAADGSLKWYAIIPSVYKPIGASVVVDDSATTVYVTCFDGEAHAFDAATGAIKWSSINTGNFVYAGTVYGTLYCLNRATGATVWSNSALSGAGFQSSPCVLAYGGKVYYPAVSGMSQ
jgi:outer membrane protein assembly factor BamB